jgi:hypothetical protein
MVKIASGILVLAALTASVSPLARAAGGDALRESRDRAQIEALMWQYVRALDTLNEEAYADAYTPDGQFGSMPNAAKGHARYHSYWMTVFARAGATAPPRVAAVGRGTDELVRLNGRWLIQSRNVAPQD